MLHIVLLECCEDVYGNLQSEESDLYQHVCCCRKLLASYKLYKGEKQFDSTRPTTVEAQVERLHSLVTGMCQRLDGLARPSYEGMGAAPVAIISHEEEQRQLMCEMEQQLGNHVQQQHAPVVPAAGRHTGVSSTPQACASSLYIFGRQHLPLTLMVHFFTNPQTWALLSAPNFTYTLSTEFIAGVHAVEAVGEGDTPVVDTITEALQHQQLSGDAGQPSELRCPGHCEQQQGTLVCPTIVSADRGFSVTCTLSIVFAAGAHAGVVAGEGDALMVDSFPEALQHQPLLSGDAAQPLMPRFPGHGEQQQGTLVCPTIFNADRCFSVTCLVCSALCLPQVCMLG